MFSLAVPWTSFPIQRSCVHIENRRCLFTFLFCTAASRWSMWRYSLGGSVVKRQLKRDKHHRIGGHLERWRASAMFTMLAQWLPCGWVGEVVWSIRPSCTFLTTIGVESYQHWHWLEVEELLSGRDDQGGVVTYLSRSLHHFWLWAYLIMEYTFSARNYWSDCTGTLVQGF